jgi:hypothetical protein
MSVSGRDVGCEIVLLEEVQIQHKILASLSPFDS